MDQVISLIKPRILSIRNRGRARSGIGGIQAWYLLAALGTIFWAGIFAVSLRVLSYFRGIQGLGDILAYKLLSMMLITLFSLLVFSSILTILSKLYLSRDLSLVHSLPVSGYKIFIARWIESTADSAWMVVVYTLPVFLSFGIIYQTGPFFYGSVGLVLLLLSFFASALSSVVVMIAVLAVPAGRIRSIFIFLGLSLFLILFIAFRMLRPEQLVDPEIFANTMGYLKSLKTPSSPLIPTTWAFDTLKTALEGSITESCFHLALLAAGACALSVFCIGLADSIYFKGVSKAQTAMVRSAKYKARARRRWFLFFSGPVRAITVREIKTFMRDQTQWSQLFLIAGLVVIYIYNFSVLPLEKAPIKTIYLQNILSFLNVGLAAFVLTAVTARFAFPAVSLEKEAFWLVKAAPVQQKTFLWIKFFIYFVPLLLLTEILIVATNILLNVTSFMMILSVVTIFFMVPGVVAMGIGLGAYYPDFKAENPAQAVTSYGGFLFMVICAGYIAGVLILEAGPVYNLVMAELKNRPISILEWAWIFISFGSAFGLSIVAVFLPMKYGEKHLSTLVN